MEIIDRSDLTEMHLPGRVVQKAVGKDASSSSDRMTMGFARYSEASGPMEPHQHAEEIVYITSARDGWLRWGSDPLALGAPIPLQAGITLHIPELEWHVFGFGPGGHVEIIYFYGQVDNIRPEEIKR